MKRLCRTYWYPLYVFVRRKGYNHEDASDLTQAFFAKFLEKDYLRSVHSSLGKFRTFLLTSTHFLANEWDKSRAQRRGGGVGLLSLDELALAAGLGSVLVMNVRLSSANRLKDPAPDFKP